MAQHDLIAIASENVKAYNAGDWDRLRAILAPNVVYHELGSQRRLEGADKMIAVYRGWKLAAPDGKGVITKAFASQHSVTVEVTWTGTNTGTFPGPKGPVPPTGKAWSVLGAQVILFEGDKIVEFRQYFDLKTMLDQIGVKS